MKRFIEAVEQKIEAFKPYIHQKINVKEAIFSCTSGEMGQFINELKTTATLLAQQREPAYAELYAKRLILQFDALQRALAQLQIQKSHLSSFKSPYRFSRHIHQLPIDKRLIEYKKALRALNEKLSWLMERNYQCLDEVRKQEYLAQIQETEYRKQKCLKAIEELE